MQYTQHRNITPLKYRHVWPQMKGLFEAIKSLLRQSRKVYGFREIMSSLETNTLAYTITLHAFKVMHRLRWMGNNEALTQSTRPRTHPSHAPTQQRKRNFGKKTASPPCPANAHSGSAGADRVVRAYIKG